MTELADISMRLTPSGFGGEVIVNGEDISKRVVSLGFQARAGQPLILNIQQLAGSLELEGQGIVKVDRPGELDGKQAIYQFLDRLDPFTLEEEVLTRGNLEKGIMETAIEVMKEWAGKHDFY